MHRAPQALLCSWGAVPSGNVPSTGICSLCSSTPQEEENLSIFFSIRWFSLTFSQMFSFLWFCAPTEQAELRAPHLPRRAELFHGGQSWCHLCSPPFCPCDEQLAQGQGLVQSSLLLCELSPGWPQGEILGWL